MFCLSIAENQLPPELPVLEKECFTAFWSQAALANEFSNPLSRTFILAAQGSRGESEICGYCLVRIITHEAEILRLAVAGRQRRRQGASQLIAMVSNNLRASGVVSIFLEVAENNSAALAFYRASGFNEVGRRPGYYDQGQQAACLMSKKI